MKWTRQAAPHLSAGLGETIQAPAKLPKPVLVDRAERIRIIQRRIEKAERDERIDIGRGLTEVKTCASHCMKHAK